MTRVMLACLAGVLLVGCATSDEEYARQLKENQRKQQITKPAPEPAAAWEKSIPSREVKTVPVKTESRPPEQVITEVTKPKEPTLIDVLKDKVLVSPYTLVSPITGKWAWVPDPTFVLLLTPEGQMQYGPTQSGFYQMLSPVSIRFQITQVNGVSVGGTAPQDWQVAFFENNTVLLLSKGAQAMPFKRVE